MESGLAPTRSRAADLVRRGMVSVAGVTALKPGALVAPDAELRLSPGASRYVSRGGEKLEAALDAFGFDPNCTIALDIGASTGGFSDVLIARGAAKIYAVDVGHGQLHAKLRVNPRVIALEGTDARALDRAVVGEQVTAIVADVSFISLTLVLPAALAARRAGRLAGGAGQAAIRGGPRGRRQRRHRAECRRPRQRLWKKCGRCIEDAGWTVVGEIASPILGGSGNEEFLIGARHAA